MLAWLKLSHIDHTGRLRPHEHTSYFALGVLLLVVGMTLTVYSVSASPGPQSGSVGLTGTMPGPPPSTAAVIIKPSDGQRFGTSPITVSGTCPKDTLVEIFKNDIFAGSTLCQNGNFTLEVDLLFGKNTLIARVYDALNQTGPDSTAVNVSYDALPPQSGPLTPLEFVGQQLVLNTDAVYRGVFPQKDLNVPINILGGTPPYALNVQWGDANNKVVSRNDNIPFDIDHAYTKPGTYQIALQASDTVGRVAFLTVAAIVNGQPAVASTTNTNVANQLLMLWPLYVGAVATVASFWLGEHREKRMLAKRGLLLAPPQ